MTWHEAIRPRIWKVLFSLIPFLLPVIQVIFGFRDGEVYEYMPVAMLIALDDVFSLLGFIESIISRPFEPILRPLGWWSNNGIFVAPDGPLLPGSFFVAVVYSIVIYILASLFSAWRRKQT